MSNPAVITLDSEKSGCLHSFRVEDNIGEAIHVHFDEIRLDFTFDEYLNFANSVKKSIDDLNIFDEQLSRLPYDFLKRYSDFLSNYEKIEIETIEASKLYSIEEIKLFYRIPLKAIKKLIKTDTYKNNIYANEANFDSLPFSDLRFIKNKIEQIKAGKRLEVILFSGSNIVRDGKLTAIAYVYLYGKKCEIPVKRVYLKNNFKDNLMKNNIVRIFNLVIGKILRIIKK